ncbi:protein-glutamine gamma-glutamyltransferase E-like [Rhinatrema bivittatum]|uniref:protein-glutamine gamma-glutamyltransferase E-like n=1 Tax=Rhinatrema bivittatum TaxID=194408 RepID=UPI0011269E0C|nr:protein-glutamine gamma-glutamyltransferase E-like [Rhinatrema bivittatum]
MALQFTKIDLQLHSNRSEHHTDHYHSQELILRRGQDCKATLTLSRAVQPKEKITFTAETVTVPKSTFPLSNSASPGSWSAVQNFSSSNTLTITISIPANAIIGCYNLIANITFGQTSSPIQLGKFILLFNAWSPDDSVYMANEAERKEYVLNESGLIYKGNVGYITSMGWNYGQFQENILNVCLAMLDRSLYYQQEKDTDCSQRNNPTYVGRVISAMVNSQDDNGVLVGNWSDTYTGGVHPGSWNGSVAILQKWSNSGFTPVKYAQCWVYAGVTCTVLRCLGIPARTITNFNSAHDVDKNLRIDEYYDNTGNALDIGGDSIWNFHVWNECWFNRDDLGSTYGGWQALDATPQEQSGGLYCCGPMSVKAIKEGDVDLDFDGPFLFAEVNADCVIWMCYSKEKKERLLCNTKTVGQAMSTKAVGSNTREDITLNYKYIEGSAEERQFYEKAYEKICGTGPKNDSSPANAPVVPSRFSASDQSEISGKFKLVEELKYGDDISLSLILKNLTSTAKNITVKITAASSIYTRRTLDEILKDTQSVALGPTEEKQLPLKITYSQYETYLSSGQLNVKVTAICEIEHGAKLWVEKHITLETPPVIIKLLGQAAVNKPGKVEVVFVNPLDEEVTDCELLIVGSGLIKGMVTEKKGSVKAKETLIIPVELHPTSAGRKQLSANFSCSKFLNIKTFLAVDVETAPKPCQIL